MRSRGVAFTICTQITITNTINTINDKWRQKDLRSLVKASTGLGMEAEYGKEGFDVLSVKLFESINL